MSSSRRHGYHDHPPLTLCTTLSFFLSWVSPPILYGGVIMRIHIVATHDSWAGNSFTDFFFLKNIWTVTYVSHPRNQGTVFNPPPEGVLCPCVATHFWGRGCVGCVPALHLPSGGPKKLSRTIANLIYGRPAGKTNAQCLLAGMHPRANTHFFSFFLGQQRPNVLLSHWTNRWWAPD